VAFTWCKDTAGKECNVYIKDIGVEPPFKLTGQPAPEYSSVWSPDGRNIAFLRIVAPTRAALIIVPHRGGRERVLAEIDRIETWAMLSGTLLAWAPNSKWIAVSEAANLTHSLFLHSVDTGERRKLTNPPQNRIGDTSPVFSSDGQTLAFMRTSGGSQVYVLRLDDAYRPRGEPQRVELRVNVSTRPAAWIGEGREVLFLAGFTSMSGMSLWRAAIDQAGTARRFTFAGNTIYSAATSHRSNRLAYSLETSDSNIWRFELDGLDGKVAPPNRFIATTRRDGQPSHSPDGKRIAFVSESSGAHELWVCDNDASNATQLTFLSGPTVLGPRWSRDSVFRDARRRTATVIRHQREWRGAATFGESPEEK